MKSYHASSGAGIEGLVVREHEMPRPGPQQVLVRVRASALNARELSILRGEYPLPVKPDVVMVADGAGEVVALGEGVRSVKIGERVIGAMFPRFLDGRFSLANAAQLGGSIDGMLTEYAVLEEQGVLAIPEHLSFIEAATLPCAGVTAWNALAGARPVAQGDTVLTLGTGGVSLFAVQFAKALGARVIATTSNDAKAERLKALGADDVINYRTTPAWHTKVRELTGGRGVDRVIEVAGSSMEQSLRSTAIEGEVAFVGRLAGFSKLDVQVLYNAIATVRVIAAGSSAQLRSMCDAIAAHRLRPVIDRVFGFDEAIEAFRYFDAGQAFGKVVISQE